MIFYGTICASQWTKPCQKGRHSQFYGWLRDKVGQQKRPALAQPQPMNIANQGDAFEQTLDSHRATDPGSNHTWNAHLRVECWACRSATASRSLPLRTIITHQRNLCCKDEELQAVSALAITPCLYATQARNTLFTNCSWECALALTTRVSLSSLHRQQFDGQVSHIRRTWIPRQPSGLPQGMLWVPIFLDCIAKEDESLTIHTDCDNRTPNLWFQRSTAHMGLGVCLLLLLLTILAIMCRLSGLKHMHWQDKLEGLTSHAAGA